MNYAVSYHQAYLKIKNSRRLLVISHLNPDGDALSSVCAFLELANLLNLEVEAYCHGKKGDTFNYLPHEEKIFFDKTKLAPLTAYDVVLVLDCGSLSRTNLAQEILAVSRSFDRPYIIEMDHHHIGKVAQAPPAPHIAPEGQERVAVPGEPFAVELLPAPTPAAA